MTTKYPSTAQFRNAVNFLKHNVQQGKVHYIGTVKIHGTNGSIVKEEDGSIYLMSKSTVLGEHQDNSGFYAHMSKFNLEPLFTNIENTHLATYGKLPNYPIRISGEWAGKGIQRGVAVSELDKFFAIFGIRFGNEEDSSGRSIGWQSITQWRLLRMEEARIFNICEFGVYNQTIDVTLPAAATQALTEKTEQVEKVCPVGAHFGVVGVGEGIVWTPLSPILCSNPQSWFKVKGQKHSVSKVKTLAAVDPEVIENMQKFVEYACTENRLDQALQEVGLDQKKIGAFIGWVNKDINKEEADVLKANNLTMKQVGKLLSNKAREFYMAKLAEF